MKEEISKTISGQYYDNFVIYKNKYNIDAHIAQMQDFYHGLIFNISDGKKMFHIKMNICDLMVRTKASKLCSTPIYLAYTADNNKVDCIALRRFDEYNLDKLSIEVENFQSALNGLVNGTEIVFYRWDDDDTSYKGIYKGGLKMEHIDPRCFAVANPNILDIQNQEWVMFWKDESLGELIKHLDKNDKEYEKKKERLEAEARKSYPDDINNDKDILSHALVRVYTRYFRMDGEVFFTLETDTVEIFKFPHPLSRRLSKNVAKKAYQDYIEKLKKDRGEVETYGNKVVDFDIDFEDMVLNSDIGKAFTDREYEDVKEKFSIYPFEVFRPVRINNNFYGRSDVAAIANIQLAINFMFSMLAQIVQNTAYNPIFAKPDALGGQVITNEANQIIYDFSNFTNGWGLKFAETQPVPNGMLTLINDMFAMTRTVYGFSEVMDGSINNQDMSGFMLQQMIKQSNTPIEQQQKIFWKFNVGMAEIRLMFYKHYVDKARYSFDYTDAEFDREEQSRKALYAKLANGEKLEKYPDAKLEDFATPTHRTQVRDLNGEDIYGVNFDISCKAMQGLQDSALVEQQTFDNLIINGGIQNITPDVLAMYLQASPSISQRTKDALNRIVENLKQSTIQQQQAQIQDLTQKLQQAAQIISQLDASNKKATLFAKNLQSEFTGKINNANKIIEGLAAELDKKSQGEVKSANARGVGGEHITETPVQ